MVNLQSGIRAVGLPCTIHRSTRETSTFPQLPRRSKSTQVPRLSYTRWQGGMHKAGNGGFQSAKNGLLANDTAYGRRSYSSKANGMCTLVLLIIIAVWSFAGGLIVGRFDMSTERAWALLFTQSPLAQAIPLRADLPYTDTRLLPGHPFSNFTLLELDSFDTWQNISSNQWIWITRSELIDLGGDPEVAVKKPSSDSQEEVFTAAISVLHRLHCLDALKKEIAKPTSQTDFELGHLWHCMEEIRQTLVCSANTDVVPFHWYEDGTIVDYVIHDKCGNFDAITRWAEARKLGQNPFELPILHGQPMRDRSTLPRIRYWY